MHHSICRRSVVVSVWSAVFAFAAALAGTPSLDAQAVAPAKPAPQAPASPRQQPADARDLPAQNLPLPSARSILDRYVNAIGGRKSILSHSSSHATGTFSVPSAGISGAIDVYTAKPNKALVKTNIGGIGEIAEGFDGTHGWGFSPMTGPSLAEGVELEQKRFDADFYSDLHEDARYSSMKTLEKTTFEGRPVYKVSLVKRIGGEDIELFDTETGFRVGTIGSREGPMGAMMLTVSHGDYKKFGDTMVPTTIKQTFGGVQTVITITSLEFDNVPPATFEIPEKIKALIK